MVEKELAITDQAGTPEVKSENVLVSREQLAQLLQQNKELKEMTIASGDALLIVMELFGGKLPTNVAQGIALLTRIPKMVESFDETKREHLRNCLAKIALNSEKYLTPDQVKMVEKYKLKELATNV